MEVYIAVAASLLFQLGLFFWVRRSRNVAEEVSKIPAARVLVVNPGPKAITRQPRALRQPGC